jgi:uncharacterized protein (DUF697 family)
MAATNGSPLPAPPAPPSRSGGMLDAGRWAGDLAGFVVDRLESADERGARRTVSELRRRHPEWDDEQLVGYLIERKARQTALIGAATAGGALLPGLGTILSITVGVAADIGASVKLHAELVLEIAAVHGRVLTPEERRKIIGLVMGLSTAQSQLVVGGVRRMTGRLVQRYGTRWIAKGVPLLGAATSATASALATTVVGKRAHAYFQLPPEETDEPEERLRAITGIDAPKLREWVRGAAGRLRPGRRRSLPDGGRLKDE